MPRVFLSVSVVALVALTGLPVLRAAAAVREYPVPRGGPPHGVRVGAVDSVLLRDALAASSCAPTRPDALGPFYKPNAPLRTRVGTGHVLKGTVLSAANCAAIPGARVEVWMAGPNGDYTDEFRATMLSDAQGRYRFESHQPPPYSGRPPHIHVRTSASGYQTLVTQYYPKQGHAEATFDLVLIPGR